LQQKHAEEQKLLQEKQLYERQNQSKAKKDDRPPEAKPQLLQPRATLAYGWTLW